LLMFPDGRLVPRWRPLPRLMLYAVALAGMSALAYRLGSASRNVGLVLVFGALAPLAGVFSQGYRFRRPSGATERQLSRLLLWALIPALIVSAYALSTGLTAPDAQRTLKGRALVVLP